MRATGMHEATADGPELTLARVITVLRSDPPPAATRRVCVFSYPNRYPDDPGNSGRTFTVRPN